jgi:hypothetical protein
MHRSRRRAAARLAGWVIVLTLYASGLLFAADLANGAPSDDSAVQASTALAQEMTVPESESPVMTLVLAAASIAAVGVARAVGTARRRERRVVMRPTSTRVSSPT